MSDFGFGIYVSVILFFIGGMIFYSVSESKKNKKWHQDLHYKNGVDYYKRKYSIDYSDKNIHFLKGYLEERCEHKDSTTQDQILLAIVDKLIEME